MPKTSRNNSNSSKTKRVTPYPSFGSVIVDEVEKWEEAICPICMEHPHNAVLFMCSSHDKGCYTYMCNTSNRHTNCLQQFCKLSSQDDGDSDEEIEDIERRGSKKQLKLVCPLYRGDVNGWIVVERARSYMNAKIRSCACETCDYSGTYSDLRKHAKIDHPMERPSIVDPKRQREWRRMEQGRAARDLISTIDMASAPDSDYADLWAEAEEMIRYSNNLRRSGYHRS